MFNNKDVCCWADFLLPEATSRLIPVADREKDKRRLANIGRHFAEKDGAQMTGNFNINRHKE